MKNCKRCNNLLVDDATFCSMCGCRVDESNIEENNISTPPLFVAAPPKRINVCSLLAIIFGAIGIIPLLNFLFLPVAIILAIIGLILSKNRGKGVTIAGVAVVMISLVISIAWISPMFSENTVDSEDDTETSSVESSTEEQYEYISFPDTTTTDYFQIDIESVYTSKEIRPSRTNGLYSYKQAETGKQYCYIKGTIKNTSGTAHQISFLGDFVFDNTYTYNGLLLKEVDNGIDNVLMYETLQPLEKIEFYYACCIPDETINNYNSAEVKFEVITDLYESSSETKYNKYSLSFGK